MKSAPRALAVKSSTQQAPYVTSPITRVSASVNLENTEPRLKMTPDPVNNTESLVMRGVRSVLAASDGDRMLYCI